MQFHSAKKEVKVLVTRNIRHFEAIKGEMEILTPEGFMKRYQPNSLSLSP